MSTTGIPPLEWPPPDPEHSQALGQFIVAWGQLEAEIDHAIEEVFRIESALSGVIPANLGTKAKLDIFHAAMHVLEDRWGGGVLELANKLVNETLKAATDYRTHYAHGQPTRTEDQYGDPLWVWIKWAARKGGVRGDASEMQESAPDFARHEVTRLIVSWHGLREMIARDRPYRDFSE